MRPLHLALAGLATASCASVAAPVPPEPGRYCRIDEVVGDTGQGTIELGRFVMVADVQRTAGGHIVHFYNSMPDSQQILTGEGPARVLASGDLAFDFQDGWGNLGRGGMSPRGVMTLEIARPAEDPYSRNIGRNYGTFELSRAACSDPDLRNFHFNR